MTNETGDKKVKRKRIRIRIPSCVVGLNPVEWIIEINGSGLRARKAGESKSDTYAATWRTIIGVLMVHEVRKEISTHDVKSHLKKKKKKRRS